MAITLGALVLALIAVGAVVSFSADRLPSGPEVDPPVQPAAAHTPISYDAQTRLASVREMNFCRLYLKARVFRFSESPPKVSPAWW